MEPPRPPPPRVPTARQIGRRGEQLAAAHLRRRGFCILAANRRTRSGEIDLIAYDGRVLAFVEVKSAIAAAPSGAAAGAHAGQPLARLGPRQRRRLRRLASEWLADRSRPRPRAREIRFDAIGVLIDRGGALVRLDHLEGAW